TCICVIVFLRLSGVRFCVLRLDRMTDRQSGLLKQLEARDFSRVRLHGVMKADIVMAIDTSAFWDFYIKILTTPIY
ncbi:MAG: hypothetical protein IJS40_05915, partial [Synergistaceae bacterium]|nr:hypothetical protein [Synergistaceae bacterium]